MLVIPYSVYKERSVVLVKYIDKVLEHVDFNVGYPIFNAQIKRLVF